MSTKKPCLPLRAMFRRFQKYPFAIVFALLVCVIRVPTPALAHLQPQPHPGLFAVPADTFPTGSRVVQAGIESNPQLVRDQALHFGFPPTIVGRLTGYYMDAIEGDPAPAQHAYTSYLVSIFRSAHRAQLAFGLRWDSWFAANYYTTPSPAPVSLGGKGEEALFRSLDSSQPPLSELMFRRGAVLVEVFQGTVAAESTPNQLHSFWSIATELNKLARQHPFGS
jgi:hypothetical protein